MPFSNFESRHFSAEEKTAVLAALETLENALTPKLANVSADERVLGHVGIYLLRSRETSQS